MTYMNQDIIVPFAKTNFRNKEVAFGIKTDDRRRHMYVIGKTGMGKTNMLENLAIQDIRNGHGMCFIDPHGDSAEKLISMIPAARLDDVIYFNPGDQDYPLAFNVMESVDARFRPLVASGLIGVFQKLWADSWGPRLEYILRNAILALLECPDSTLLGVMRILVDKKYRIYVINHVKDPVVRAFWVDEFSQWNERVLQEVISPIQNKVGQFLTSPLIRNVVGQESSSFNVRKSMDSNKIMILNLAKGRIGEDNSALLGAMMVTKIQLAAMGRVDIEEADRKDFYLYVDEFQNFATESFANILSEARKYRLSLILANQYIAQLQEEVRDAIFGNVGTIVSFRVGAADAEELEKEFDPIFLMNDIVNLPKYSIYLKLMIDGIAGDAFSASTLPPIANLEGDSTDNVIRASREKYANDIETVERRIMEWSGMTVPTATPTPSPAPGTNQSPSGGTSSNARPPQAKRSQGVTSPRTTPASTTPFSMQSTPYIRKTQITNSTNTSTSSNQPNSPHRHTPALNPVVAATPTIAPNAVAVPETTKSTEVPVPDEPTVGVTQAPLEAPQSFMDQQPNPDQRQMYDAICAMCGLAIQVPFKPDGSRPVYCKECLKEVQRTKAKQQEEGGQQKVSPQRSVTSTDSSSPPARSQDSQSLKDLISQAQSKK